VFLGGNEDMKEEKSIEITVPLEYPTIILGTGEIGIEMSKRMVWTVE